MAPTPPDWTRLASYVVSARVAAGYKDRRAFAAATGVTERTLGKLENGLHVSPGTLAAVAHTVGWSPDSPRQILAGGEPVLTGQARAANGSGPPQRPPDPDGHMRPAYDDPDLEEFAQRLERDPRTAGMWNRDIEQAVAIMEQRKRLLIAEARVTELERENAALRAEVARLRARARLERQGALPAGAHVW